ncbi:MAG TPA: polysaccharide pyruvyl transferase family protein [Vicinamibacteria bacterium]|nr:polysaccharide pyruvyl transferase family protein [Vicinamibacteria bacterium]
MSTLLLVADVGGVRDCHLGDEAMLEANVAALRALDPGLRFVVRSRDPRHTAERLGVDAIPAPAPPPALPAAEFDLDAAARERVGWLLDEPSLETLRRGDGLLVCGGGNLCATWPGKLLERAALVHAAADLGRPAVVVGQTLGPALKPRQASLLGAALARARLVGVREAASAELALALGVPRAALRLQLDDAFFLEPLPAAGRPGIPGEGGRFVLVTLDPSLAAAAGEPGLIALASQLDSLAEALSVELVFLPHVTGAEAEARGEGDLAVAERLSGMLRTPLALAGPLSPREAVWLIGRATLVVSSRYHGVVFASAAGVPSLGVYADAYTRVKLKGALAHAGLSAWALDLGRAARGELLTAGLELWYRRDQVRSRLAALREEQGAREPLRLQAVGSALGLERARAARPAVAAVAASRVSPPAVADVPSAWLTEGQWREYLERGYLRLGRVLDAPALAALRERLEAIVRCEVRLPALATQADTGGAYEALPDAVPGAPARGVPYRKVQGLEGDLLFLDLLRLGLFREICARHYGAHAPVSIFRAMVMNKPARQGTHLPWHQDGGDVWKLDRDPLVTTWVALDDATREKGCLEVVPGSHRLGLLTREGSTLRAEDVEKHCPPEAVVAVEVAAGEGLLLHNWLVHRSGVNATDEPRRAFTACYMDGRTLASLTGSRFPVVFGEPEEPEESLPFLRELRRDVSLLRETAEESVRYARSLEGARREAERYAWSLEAEIARLRGSAGPG